MTKHVDESSVEEPTDVNQQVYFDHINLASLDGFLEASMDGSNFDLIASMEDYKVLEDIAMEQNITIIEKSVSGVEVIHQVVTDSRSSVAVTPEHLSVTDSRLSVAVTPSELSFQFPVNTELDFGVFSKANISDGDCSPSPVSDLGPTSPDSVFSDCDVFTSPVADESEEEPVTRHSPMLSQSPVLEAEPAKPDSFFGDHDYPLVFTKREILSLRYAPIIELEKNSRFVKFIRDTAIQTQKKILERWGFLEKEKRKITVCRRKLRNKIYSINSRKRKLEGEIEEEMHVQELREEFEKERKLLTENTEELKLWEQKVKELEESLGLTEVVVEVDI